MMENLKVDAKQMSIMNLMSKHYRRKIYLIKFLIEKKGHPFHLTDINQLIECSKDTLYKDLLELEAEFPNDFKVIHSAKGFEVEVNESIQVDTYINRFKREQPFHRILLTLLTKGPQKMMHLAEMSYLTRPALYKLLDTVNSYLSKAYPTISFQKSPARLEGPEKDIRAFLVEFFSFGNVENDWQFATVDQKTVIELLKLVTSYADPLAYFMHHPRLQIIVAVNIIRTRQVSFVEDLGFRCDNDSLQEMLSRYPHVKRLEEKLQFSLNCQTMEQLLYGAFSYQRFLNMKMLSVYLNRDKEGAQALKEAQKSLADLAALYGLEDFLPDNLDPLMLSWFNLCYHLKNPEKPYDFSIPAHEEECLRLPRYYERVDRVVVERLKVIEETMQRHFTAEPNANLTRLMTIYAIVNCPKMVEELIRKADAYKVGLYIPNKLMQKMWMRALNEVLGGQLTFEIVDEPTEIPNHPNLFPEVLITSQPLYDLKYVRVIRVAEEPTLERITELTKKMGLYSDFACDPHT